MAPVIVLDYQLPINCPRDYTDKPYLKVVHVAKLQLSYILHKMRLNTINYTQRKRTSRFNKYFSRRQVVKRIKINFKLI